MGFWTDGCVTRTTRTHITDSTFEREPKQKSTTQNDLRHPSGREEKHSRHLFLFTTGLPPLILHSSTPSPHNRPMHQSPLPLLLPPRQPPRPLGVGRLVRPPRPALVPPRVEEDALVVQLLALFVPVVVVAVMDYALRRRLMSSPFLTPNPSNLEHDRVPVLAVGAQPPDALRLGHIRVIERGGCRVVGGGQLGVGLLGVCDHARRAGCQTFPSSLPLCPPHYPSIAYLRLLPPLPLEGPHSRGVAVVGVVGDGEAQPLQVVPDLRGMVA